MAPPSITPSPHRFISTKPTNPTRKPTSSLRFQQSSTRAPSSSQQFASTPKFNLSSTQKSKHEPAALAPQYSSPLSRRPHLPIEPFKKNREGVEGTISDKAEDEDEDPNNNNPPTFVPPTLPPPKRRQPNPPETSASAIIISSSPSPSSSPPSTPPHRTTTIHAIPIHRLSAHPHFLLPTPPRTTTPSIPTRPPLILPPRSPSPPPSAPAFYSPSRRGQKYIPGGLAAGVRDWIVEASQGVYQKGKRGSGEAWDFEVRVQEFVAGVFVLVREREEGRRWMFVGRGGGEEVIGEGCLVGIRGPSWEVEIGGEGWRVAVDWKVLGG